jgi:hypothetical protein
LVRDCDDSLSKAINAGAVEALLAALRPGMPGAALVSALCTLSDLVAEPRVAASAGGLCGVEKVNAVLQAYPDNRVVQHNGFLVLALMFRADAALVAKAHRPRAAGASGAARAR